MCILLGAVFEMSFYPSMDTAKNVTDNNIKLVIHLQQIKNNNNRDVNSLNQAVTFVELDEEFFNLYEICSWKYDVCVNEDDECCCIKKLAERAFLGEGNFVDIISKKYEDIIKYDLLREGKYTIMKSYLSQREHEWGDRYEYNQGMGWHRSEERVFGTNPFRGYRTNKKWLFNEDITIFIFTIM